MEDATVVNGWTLFAHPMFLDQVEALAARVEALRARGPKGWRSKNETKRLAAIVRLALEVIPQDPAREDYRQGDALGEARRHWFRAKFFQQYRLFFRFDSASRIIVFAWVNDAESKRAYGSDDDAYRVFSRMLKRGNPPDAWDVLLGEARAGSVRLENLSSTLDDPDAC